MNRDNKKRFRFMHEREDGVIVELGSDAVTLEELLDNFQDFLSGCSFYLDHGQLEFCEKEEEPEDCCSNCSSCEKRGGTGEYRTNYVTLEELGE